MSGGGDWEGHPQSILVSSVGYDLGLNRSSSGEEPVSAISNTACPL